MPAIRWATVIVTVGAVPVLIPVSVASWLNRLRQEELLRLRREVLQAVLPPSPAAARYQGHDIPSFSRIDFKSAQIDVLRERTLDADLAQFLQGAAQIGPEPIKLMGYVQQKLWRRIEFQDGRFFLHLIAFWRASHWEAVWATEGDSLPTSLGKYLRYRIGTYPSLAVALRLAFQENQVPGKIVGGIVRRYTPHRKRSIPRGPLPPEFWEGLGNAFRSFWVESTDANGRTILYYPYSNIYQPLEPDGTATFLGGRFGRRYDFFQRSEFNPRITPLSQPNIDEILRTSLPP